MKFSTNVVLKSSKDELPKFWVNSLQKVVKQLLAYFKVKHTNYIIFTSILLRNLVLVPLESSLSAPSK